MTLLDFWPAAERIRECLNALHHGDAKLVLAVHQPMCLRIDMPSAAVTEQELLKTIFYLKHSGIITFTGTAGVGKSHLLNWLVAELSRHSDVRRRMVLKFQSSDSRETVLDKLAEAFPDSSVLHDATIPTDTFDARSADSPMKVRDRFVLALEKAEAEAKQRLAEAKQSGASPSAQDRDVGTWLAQGLRDYFSDPITGNPFLAPEKGEFWALMETIASPQKTLSSPAVFRPEHLIRQKGVDILRASKPAQLFYKKLNLTSDQFRVASANLMNELVSEVLAELVPSQQLSLKTIVELLQQELVATGHELLILIEESKVEGDLADLVAGSQKWHIEPRVIADRSESMDAIAEFVAAYLNANRGSEEDLEPEARNQVLAFGRSKNGLPLFPLNYAAIEKIAEANNLIDLHPGRIGECFFEKLLFPYREMFLQGELPPADFLDFDFSRLGEEIHRAIEQQYPDKAGRYLSLLAFWGDCPTSLHEIQLSEHVYHAFGLEPLVLTETPTVAVPVTELPQTSRPGEVQVFFDAVHSGGASLGLLTEAVLRWLTETQQFQDFMVVKKLPEDEITCGLS